MARIKALQAQVLSEPTRGVCETPTGEAAPGNSLNFLVLTSFMFVYNFMCMEFWFQHSPFTSYTWLSFMMMK